jgi:hypothetical protein
MTLFQISGPSSTAIFQQLGIQREAATTVGTFVVSRAGKAYDAPGEFRALSRADCLSRVSSDRTRTVVSLLELPATSVPRTIIAAARVSILTPNNVGVCVDDEYTTTHSRH